MIIIYIEVKWSHQEHKGCEGRNWYIIFYVSYTYEMTNYHLKVDCDILKMYTINIKATQYKKTKVKANWLTKDINYHNVKCSISIKKEEKQNRK